MSVAGSLPVYDPLEELWVPVHDDVEWGAVAGKHVVLTRHVLDLAHVLWDTCK